MAKRGRARACVADERMLFGCPPTWVRAPPRPAATPARAAPRALAPWAQVDDDQNETISIGEWLDFWKNVLAQDCYTEEDIAEAGELV